MAGTEHTLQVFSADIINFKKIKRIKKEGPFTNVRKIQTSKTQSYLFVPMNNSLIFNLLSDCLIHLTAWMFVGMVDC